MGVGIEVLRNGINDLLESHPSLEPFQSTIQGAKGARLRRYLTFSGHPIGHEHTLKTHQNIWVRRDDVRWNRLRDIECILKTAAELRNSDGANSNLFAVPAFQDADLIRFKIINLSQAARVITEVVS